MKHDLALSSIVTLAMLASFAIGYWAASMAFPQGSPAMVTIEDDDGELYEPPEKLIPIDYHQCALGAQAEPGYRYMQWKWFMDNRSPQCARLKHKHSEHRVAPKLVVETWDA